jgi:hypothetical protein
MHSAQQGGSMKRKLSNDINIKGDRLGVAVPSRLCGVIFLNDVEARGLRKFIKRWLREYRA